MMVKQDANGGKIDMTERIVRVVEATRQMHTMAPLAMPTRRKAACYLRISTRSDEQ